MGRKKKIENVEKLLCREEVQKARGLSLRFIRENLKHIEYDLGYRTKRYKLSDVDLVLSQKKHAS